MTGWRLHTKSDGIGHRGFVDQPEHCLAAAELREVQQRVADRRLSSLAELPDTAGQLLVDLYWEDGWVAVARGRGANFGPEYGTLQIATPPHGWRAAEVWATLLSARTERGWFSARILADAQPPGAPPVVLDDTAAYVLQSLGSGADVVVVPGDIESAETAIDGVLRVLPESVARLVQWSSCHLPRERLPGVIVTGTSDELSDVGRSFDIVADAARRQPPVLNEFGVEIRWLVAQARDGNFPLLSENATSVREALEIARGRRPPTQQEWMRRVGLFEPYSYVSTSLNDKKLLDFQDPTLDDLVARDPALGIHLLATADAPEVFWAVRSGLHDARWGEDPLGLRGEPSPVVTSWLWEVSRKRGLESFHSDLLRLAVNGAFPSDPEGVRDLSTWLVRAGASDDVQAALIPFDGPRAVDLLRRGRYAEAATGMAQAGFGGSQLGDVVGDFVGYHLPASDGVHVLHALATQDAWRWSELRTAARIVQRGWPADAWIDEAMQALESIPPDIDEPIRSGWMLRYLLLEAARGSFDAVARRRPAPDRRQVELPGTPSATGRGAAEPVGPRPSEARPVATAPAAGARAESTEPESQDEGEQLSTGSSEISSKKWPPRWVRASVKWLKPWAGSSRDEAEHAEVDSDRQETEHHGASYRTPLTAARHDLQVGRPRHQAGPAKRRGPSARDVWTVLVVIGVLAPVTFMGWRAFDSDDPAPSPVRQEQVEDPPLAVVEGRAVVAAQVTVAADGSFSPDMVSVPMGGVLRIGTENGDVRLVVAGRPAQGLKTTWFIEAVEAGIYRIRVSGNDPYLEVRVADE